MILAAQSPSVNRIPFRFRAIPSEILARPDLGSTAKLLFAVVVDAARTTGLCRLSNTILAAAIGRSESEVYRTIIELERAGLVRRVYRGAARNCRAGLEVAWAESNAAPSPPAPVTPVAPRERSPSPAKTEAEALPAAPRERGPSVDLGEETTSGEPQDATTLIRNLPGKPESVPKVADRLIKAFHDNPDYRPKYLRFLKQVADGSIPRERGEHAVKEAIKRVKGRGFVFFDLLQSDAPIPTPKPDAHSAEIIELVNQARSPVGDMRRAGLAALGTLGYSAIEIQGLFVTHPEPPAPESEPIPLPVGFDWRSLVPAN